MKLQTYIEIPKSENHIEHHHTLMTFGSCFSDNMGEKLEQLKFNILLNPFGVIFNPVSIAQSISRLLENKTFSIEELFYANDCWNSFAHHSRFSNASKEQSLLNINQSFRTSSEKLKKTNFLLITFGTAWTYFHKEKGITVANCHKLPSDVFERKLLKPEEIVETYLQLMQSLKTVNPNIRFIYTISPVRHLKDGAHGNQVSKSVLQLAIHELIKTEPCEYFPAYEILLDELRDYRFYEQDMVHPSDIAIEYIFEKFVDTYFSTETNSLNKEIFEIHKALQHRPINPQSYSHRKFIEQLKNRIVALEKLHPFLDYSAEKRKLLINVL